MIDDHDLKKSLKNCIKSSLLNLFLFVKSISLNDKRALCFSEPALSTSYIIRNHETISKIGGNKYFSVIVNIETVEQSI